MLRLRLRGAVTLLGGLLSLCALTVTSAHATHPRPKSASPLQMSLVPAYAPCAAPNRTHGPPLAFPSCNPPAQTSGQATVGTADAFGGAPNATGYLRLKVLIGAPTPDGWDEDVRIDMALNDVRCVPTGARCGTANASGPADYSGELRFSFSFRVTDHWSGTTPAGGTDPATVQDFTIEHSWACVQSGSTSTGSTCDLATSLDAVAPFPPEAAQYGRRGNWELNAARIHDGGADGDGDTTPDNTVFARPGVFIP